MYAIIETGGKQYRVTEGLKLKVELLDVPVGSVVDFTAVLVNNDGIISTGAEAKKASVKAEVIYNGKDKKIHIFTYKAKKNVRKRQGHRQPYSQVQITSIVG
ncbi:MAG: 50S ribosomal protein L21 [Christensenellaceae bacterium]|jgi:large subunit ribosomal protein L21|nr:50S ribosomal protein L21 [Christensenellaceae bacterium]